jgi:hypothetical protein
MNILDKNNIGRINLNSGVNILEKNNIGRIDINGPTFKSNSSPIILHQNNFA